MHPNTIQTKQHHRPGFKCQLSCMGHPEKNQGGCTGQSASTWVPGPRTRTLYCGHDHLICLWFKQLIGDNVKQPSTSDAEAQSHSDDFLHGLLSCHKILVGRLSTQCLWVSVNTYSSFLSSRIPPFFSPPKVHRNCLILAAGLVRTCDPTCSQMDTFNTMFTVQKTQRWRKAAQ